MNGHEWAAGPEPVVIGIGSNIHCESSVAHALELLDEAAPVLAVSTFYWTPALARPSQHDYLNGACRVCAAREPGALKQMVLRPIEAALGRERTLDRYAPRTIDLDILLYGDVVLDEPGLRIPSPEIHERPFVAWPLLELVPDGVLPDTGEPLRAVAERLGRGSMTAAPAVTRRLKERYNA